MGPACTLLVSIVNEMMDMQAVTPAWNEPTRAGDNEKQNSQPKGSVPGMLREARIPGPTPWSISNNVFYSW